MLLLRILDDKFFNTPKNNYKKKEILTIIKKALIHIIKLTLKVTLFLTIK